MIESLHGKDVDENQVLQIQIFEKISPGKDMAPEDARKFWDGLFEQEEGIRKGEPEKQDNPHREVVDGKAHYYDDNGKLYRVDNDLVPNSEYELNGYKYKTDERGRVVSAGGTLHLKDREGRLPISDSIEDIGKGDQMEGDDRGHLIGDQFDGSNGLENMIPQDAYINRNDFKDLENELAKMVKEGKEVTVNVEPIYDGDSRRPIAIVYTYTIDGEESIRIFPNEQEDNHER